MQIGTRVHEVRKEVMRSTVTQTCMRIVDLEKENEELRKIAEDMWDFFGVSSDDPLAFPDEIDFCNTMRARMQKVGIKCPYPVHFGG